MSELYKTASTAIKNEANQPAAKTALLAALTRTDISQKEKANIHFQCALLEESLNGVQNRKAYLKQPYDTAAFFNHLLQMYEELRLCDSIDCLPYSNGKVKNKFESKTRGLRKEYYKNILNGGRFFLKKNNYAVAFSFIDAAYEYAPNKADTTIQKLPYLATLCGYMTQNPQRTLKHINRALQIASLEQRPILQEYRVRACALMKNDSAWVRELQRGVYLYPQHDYFFVNLADWYYSHHQIQQGINMADSLIEVCGSRALYWYSKSKLMLSDGNYEKCIEYSDSTIAKDPKFTDAYYNKGSAYLNQAVIARESACTDIKNPRYAEDRKIIQFLYQSARPCMEMVRKLDPKNPKRWAPPLYRIYMNLNMGKEFEEIDKVLNTPESVPEQKKK